MVLDYLRKFLVSQPLFKNALIYFVVLSFFFSLFFYVQFSFADLADPDAYYHIKHSWLIRTQGIDFSVRNFLWLQFTILKNYPGDPWLGYHLLLLPFTFGDLIFGVKLSAVFFASLLFLGFFFVLRGFRIRYAFFWTLFLFFLTHIFTWRLLLARPFVLSILFSLLGFYFIFKKRYISIFVLAFFYSFITVEAPLLIFMTLFLGAIEWLKTKRIDWRPLISATIGLLGGLLFRPDFPQNLFLLYHTTFGILFLRLSGMKLSFGADLGLPFSSAPKDEIFLFLAFALPFTWIVMRFINKEWRKIPLLHFSLSFFTLFWMTFTFQINRFIEYWAPFTVLFGAISFNSLVLPKIPKIIQAITASQYYHLPLRGKKLLKGYQRIYQVVRFFVFKSEEKLIKGSIFLCFLILISYFTLNQIYILDKPWGLFSLKDYEKATLWLKENTTPGSVVLNTPWHTFPVLFFFNHQNYYCCGMDPSLMYFKSPKLYWLWENISKRGIVCDQQECLEKKEENNAQNAYKVLKNEFKADYILIDKGTVCSQDKSSYKEFLEILNEGNNFKKLFKEGEIEIYKIE